MSTTLHEKWERPDINRANKNRKTNKKGTQDEQDDPLFTDPRRASSEIPERLQEFRENLVDDEIPEHGNSHASSSQETSSKLTFQIREDLRSVNGPKLQGHLAENAMAEPYYVQKNSVT